MFTPSQINDIYPKYDKLLSIKTNTNLESWYLKEGEIALTCSGTVGNSTLVNRTLNGKLFSQNMIRMKSVDGYPGYVIAFLKSNTGKLLVARNNYGSVITHIDPEHLQNIPVPNPPDYIKKSIHDLIIKSYDLRDESNDLIDEAEQLLIEELKLPPIEKFKPKQLLTITM